MICMIEMVGYLKTVDTIRWNEGKLGSRSISCSGATVEVSTASCVVAHQRAAVRSTLELIIVPRENVGL